MDSNGDKMSRGGIPPPYASQPGQPAPQMAAAPVIVQPTLGVTVPVVVGSQMGPKPASIVCKSCNAQIVTRVEKKPTTKTHLFAALLCVFACWCCVCVPYCIDSCNNADHYCPNCSAYIGSYVN